MASAATDRLLKTDRLLPVIAFSGLAAAASLLARPRCVEGFVFAFLLPGEPELCCRLYWIWFD